MKQVTSILVICLLTSCRKDEEKPQKTDDLLLGTWHVTSDKNEYFNAANVKIYEETTRNNYDFIIYNQNISSTSNGTLSPYATYTCSNVLYKNYIRLIAPGFDTNFEVTVLTKSHMAWQREATNVLFYENSVQKLAAKTIFTVQFQR